MKPPIFIIGSPRSGTVLLRLMLTCHPAIVIPSSCGFAVWWYEKYKDWPDLDVASGDLRILAFVEDLLTSRKIETWSIDWNDLLGHLQKRDPESYAELVSAVYEWYGKSRGETFARWGAKDNFHIEHIGTLRELFPDAVFIHIVRDGRDVACSYRELNARNIGPPWAPELPNEIGAIAEQWQDNIDTAERAFSLCEWRHVVEIRFEQLVLFTEQTLRFLCLKLGENYAAAMLRYHAINREQGLVPRELLRWEEKTLLPPQASVVGRYKRDLSAEDIAAFEAVAGETLRRYGYD